MNPMEVIFDGVTAIPDGTQKTGYKKNKQTVVAKKFPFTQAQVLPLQRARQRSR